MTLTLSSKPKERATHNQSRRKPGTETAVSVVLAEGFLSLQHGTTLETRGLGEVSKRGGSPFLRLESFPTDGGAPGSRRRQFSAIYL